MRRPALMMRERRRWSLFACLGLLTLVWACSPPPPVKRGTGSGSTDGNGDGGGMGLDIDVSGPDLTCDPTQENSPCSPDAPAPPGCGDGILTEDEACACAAGCVIGAYCGDGIEQEGEDCDDGNRLDGDGCGSSCRNVVVK